MSTQSSNVPFEQSSNVPFCGRGVAFAHSESRRYAAPRLHFGAGGDTLHGVGWEAPMAGRGLPAKPYWRMNPGGDRLERDEAGVVMGQGWKGLGGGEPSGSRGDLGRVCTWGVCAGGSGPCRRYGRGFFRRPEGWASGLERAPGSRGSCLGRGGRWGRRSFHRR